MAAACNVVDSLGLVAAQIMIIGGDPLLSLAARHCQMGCQWRRGPPSIWVAGAGLLSIARQLERIVYRLCNLVIGSFVVDMRPLHW